jgi:hypothetical protein
LSADAATIVAMTYVTLVTVVAAIFSVHPSLLWDLEMIGINLVQLTASP